MDKTPNPGELVMTQWRQQFDTAIGVFQAMADGCRKLGEAQSKAAAAAVAAAAARRSGIASAADWQQLWRLQEDWMRDEMERSLAYWRDCTRTTLELELEAAKPVTSQLQLAAPALAQAMKARGGAPFDAMNGAYAKWMEAMQQFLSAAANASARSMAPSAAARAA